MVVKYGKWVEKNPNGIKYKDMYMNCVPCRTGYTKTIKIDKKG